MSAMGRVRDLTSLGKHLSSFRIIIFEFLSMILAGTLLLCCRLPPTVAAAVVASVFCRDLGIMKGLWYALFLCPFSAMLALTCSLCLSSAMPFPNILFRKRQLVMVRSVNL